MFVVVVVVVVVVDVDDEGLVSRVVTVAARPHKSLQVDEPLWERLRRKSFFFRHDQLTVSRDRMNLMGSSNQWTTMQQLLARNYQLLGLLESSDCDAYLTSGYLTSAPEQLDFRANLVKPN